MNETREQIVARLLEEERQFKMIRNLDFSVRVTNVLNRLGLTTMKQIRNAIVDGSLHPTNRNPLQRNFGRKSYREVCEKLGIDCTCAQNKTCPHCGKEL